MFNRNAVSIPVLTTKLKIMTTDEILKSLCYYDKRNPNGTEDDEEIEYRKAQLLKASKKLGYNKTCSCDNCFYGRTKLAEELLKLITIPVLTTKTIVL